MIDRGETTMKTKMQQIGNRNPGSTGQETLLTVTGALQYLSARPRYVPSST
jgi:hypothetical protein